MDKKVSLTINVITNGETSVKQLTASADELAKSITEVQEAHEGLNQQMININQLKQSWDNLYQGCQQVAGIVGELTAAYNTQEQAEVKLTTAEIKRRYREAMEKRGMGWDGYLTTRWDITCPYSRTHTEDDVTCG